MGRRYDAFSRSELRVLFKAWRKRNRTMIAKVLAVEATVVVAVTVILLRLPHAAFIWYVLGVLHAFAVTALLGALHTSFLGNDPHAIRHLRGAWGEEVTRDQLRAARRRRLIWDWIDSIRLEGGDIDHLVITRSGGLLAIDSKFRAQMSVDDRDAMANAARRARARAEAVVAGLLKAERGGHRAPGRSYDVRPVVVLQGPEQHKVPEGYRINGVDFVAGFAFLRWLKSLDRDPVERSAAKDLIDRLKDFRAQANARTAYVTRSTNRA